MSLSDYSQTPASNDLVSYFQTGMRPSAVKTGGWDVMADLCQQMGPGSLVTSGGTANAQTITNVRQVGALYAGRIIEFMPGFTNTGAMTLAEDGLAAKNVFANGVAAIAGMVALNVIARCRYDGTQYQLLNPQRSTGSATITQTGYASPPTGTLFYAVEPSGKMASAWTTATITGTSNATSMTWTGIPAVLTTSVSLRVLAAVQDNTGAFTWSSLDTGTSTTWTFNSGVNSGNFTASGTKATARGTFVFPIT